MVLYLFGHNVLIPLIRNIGTGTPIYYDVELFWALQVIIFYLFTQYDFEKPKKSLIPLLIYITFYSTLIGTIQLILKGRDEKITLSFFAPFISFASLWAFLIVFWIYFKKYFLWDSSNVFRRHLLALIAGIAMIVSRNVFLVNPQVKKIVREQKVIPTFEDAGCKGSKILFHLPLREIPPSQSEIQTCGFNFNLVRVSNKIEVKNLFGHPLHVRLDYLQDRTFVFKRIQVLKDKDVFIFPSVENGIYRLMTPSNPHLGIQIILKGDLKNLQQGSYLITPKNIEMNK
jgi:hypothetical protein